MPKFLEKFHRTQHDDKHNDKTASASSSSGRSSRDSKQPLAQYPSPPPYTEASTKQPFGPSSEDKAAATRAPATFDKKFQMDAGFGASYSSSQSESKGTDYPGPSTVRTSLQVCPHEDLTFERLQLIKGILLKKHVKEIDIIHNTKEKQHKQRPTLGNIWTCSANDSRISEGTFKMKLSSTPRTFFGHSRSRVIELELHVRWTLQIPKFSDNDPDKIHSCLQKFDKIPLCRHRMMNDRWIQESVYNYQTAPDPTKISAIDQYMQDTHKSTRPPLQNIPAFDCDRCKTHVEVSGEDMIIWNDIFVEITRHLGEGVVENDPAWLAQCGIEP